VTNLRKLFELLGGRLNADHGISGGGIILLGKKTV